MRRKDGKPKRKARRTKPVFEYGFWNHPSAQKYLNPLWSESSLPNSNTVVSLFSGCGGLDLGITGGFEFLDKIYQALPFNIIAALDNSKDAIDTYRLNLSTHARLSDLTEIDIADIPSADILMGGFPCQDFSSSGPKNGFAGKRGQLYQVLTEYMAYHRPKLVVGENVPHLARLKKGVYLSTIIREFEEQGYKFDVWDLYAPDYGLPQSRRRLFIIGVRNDIPGFPQRPAPTHINHYVTISEGLRDLEAITDESVTNQSQYFVATRATAGGGQGDHTNAPDRVAYCIRANARGRIQFHHTLPRRLTVRECARLQSFPDQFVFPFSTQRNLTLIGNAVPPILGHFVGRSISQFMSSVGKGEEKQQPFVHSHPLLAEKLDSHQLTLFSSVA